MSGGQKAVEVYVDLDGTGGPTHMGTLHAQSSGREEVFSFAYAREWLAGEQAFAFDPDLQLLGGAQYPASSRNNFGIFLDSSPDRWGRLLMQRPGGEFVDSDGQMAAPPLTSLRALQAASRGLEEHSDDVESPDYARWLNQLLAPGSSLGGARPKASVRDEGGALCIAKFPSRADTRNMAAWEMLAHRLAAKCGIAVPRARLLDGGDQSTFLVNRFDRTASGGRLAFVSAMTLTQRRDGEAGASYLELVELLQRQGAQTLADTHQLYRRIVFNILIHNTDDHLRNHGFFVEERGVRLSPAFDVNPSVERDDLTLAINETETV